VYRRSHLPGGFPQVYEFAPHRRHAMDTDGRGGRWAFLVGENRRGTIKVSGEPVAGA
jgi:hypothetical protein